MQWTFHIWTWPFRFDLEWDIAEITKPWINILRLDVKASMPSTKNCHVTQAFLSTTNYDSGTNGTFLSRKFCGGAIFGNGHFRQNKRFIISMDLKWLFLTVILTFDFGDFGSCQIVYLKKIYEMWYFSSRDDHVQRKLYNCNRYEI